MIPAVVKCVGRGAQGAEHPGDPSRSPASPVRRSVIGVPFSVTNYAEATGCIISAARGRSPYLVTALAVHGVVEARRRGDAAQAISEFDIVTPDGQPVWLALNLLHRAGLRDRVYGPTLMLDICERAAADGIPVYLYGSTREVVRALAAALRRSFPGLEVTGAEESAFRPLTALEGAGGAADPRQRRRIVFLGLGCPGRSCSPGSTAT